ncbi:hypothetical protein [Streptomyces sp. Qhu_M48]|uniref:hypothetical protein n=1 Tax=Streptomyces sp. Qhu_M48 TaxID=3435889 RepID=UPI003F508B56
MPESAPLIGLGAAGKTVSVDLDHDSPHVLINAGTGGGKSTILRTIACQFLHNGAQAQVSRPHPTRAHEPYPNRGPRPTRRPRPSRCRNPTPGPPP